MKKRLYAPFVKSGNRWIRATYTITNEGVQKTKEFSGYYKETAVRVYQNWLLQSALGEVGEIRELRPIPHPKRDECEYEFKY